MSNELKPGWADKAGREMAGKPCNPKALPLPRDKRAAVEPGTAPGPLRSPTWHNRKPERGCWHAELDETPPELFR